MQRPPLIQLPATYSGWRWFCLRFISVLFISAVQSLFSCYCQIIINELPLEQILRKTKVSYDQLLKMISIDNKRPRLPGSLPEALLNVIKLAWDTDPNVRPSADAILSVLEQCTSVVERLV